MFKLLIGLILSIQLIFNVDAQFSMVLKKRRKEDVLPKSHLHSNVSTRMYDVFEEAVSSRFKNTIYEGMISVGSPPQAFRVILDTGSAMLWLPKYGCVNEGRLGEYCKNGKGKDGTYNPANSTTVKPLNENFVIRYGIGQTSGRLYQDMFAFGDPVCPQYQLKFKKPIAFGAGIEITDGDQGVLGLGFARSDQKATSIFDRAVKEGLLTEPVFTVVYRACPYDQEECDRAGVITLGAIDTKRCGSPSGWLKLNRFALQWEFNIEAVMMGDHTIQLNSDVITDSGASHVFLPFWVVEDLMQRIGAKEENDGYYISCKRKWQIEFKIGGIKYPVKSKEFNMNMGNDKCQIAIGPKSREPWILGGPFLRSYCQIHHWTERKVGFSPRTKY